MVKKLSRLSRSRLLLILFCLCYFALMLLCTHWTDLIADDYRYCFSYADDTRMTRVAQIFPSKYINIGGDECPRSKWKECALCPGVGQRAKHQAKRQISSKGFFGT